jgi:hypothetical protein
MNFEELKSIFTANGCREIFVKKLSPNDNSRNQVYLGGSLDLVNIFPVSEIKSSEDETRKVKIFHADMDFSWVDDDGLLYTAPDSKLILYPQYPEVRWSGFLKRCKKAPSPLMASRLPGRVLFLAVARDRKVLGYVAAADSEIASAYEAQPGVFDGRGFFNIISLIVGGGNRQLLFAELLRIRGLGWIDSKKLDRNGKAQPYAAQNGGGYTLEAELGIRPNGKADPDFMGWEVKQYAVKQFAKPGNPVITLMTPEPTGGHYKDEGLAVFLQKYGYPDKRGRENRVNFGGVHRHGVVHRTTSLELRLIGFDIQKGKIIEPDGMVALINRKGEVAASWSFADLLGHWSRKHNQACYVPSERLHSGGPKYRYGNKLFLGIGADFELFLQLMAKGYIYYDPGIKQEADGTRSASKKRSQFRIRYKHLNDLYENYEIAEI